MVLFYDRLDARPPPRLRPSKIAIFISWQYRLIATTLSSFPGIGYVSTAGSQSVSAMPTMGMPRVRASLRAGLWRATSMMKTQSGVL